MPSTLKTVHLVFRLSKFGQCVVATEALRWGAYHEALTDLRQQFSKNAETVAAKARGADIAALVANLIQAEPKGADYSPAWYARANKLLAQALEVGIQYHFARVSVPDYAATVAPKMPNFDAKETLAADMKVIELKAPPPLPEPQPIIELPAALTPAPQQVVCDYIHPCAGH